MNNTKIERVYLLKVYDENGRLLPNVLPFRTESGAQSAAAEWVPAGRRFEIVSCEISE